MRLNEREKIKILINLLHCSKNSQVGLAMEKVLTV
jgi:hypothetical protein